VIQTENQEDLEFIMQNGLVVIRNGRLKDSLKSVRVWYEFMDYHKRVSAMDNEMVDKAGEMWVQYFERHVRSPIRKALIAEQGGEVIGFLLGEIQKRPPIFKASYQAFLDSIGVVESKRNQGIGGLMLDHFAKWASEKGAPCIMLNVVVENTAAIRLYEKHGFKTMILAQRKLL
jgi:ribosomal protein S18 acetylase RimI-like enzyme